MPFPISINGKIVVRKADLDPNSVQRIVLRLHDILDAAAAHNITLDRSHISFDAGVFRLVSSMNMLVGISSGTLTVVGCGDKIEILYHLRTVQLLIISTLMILAAVVVVNADTRSVHAIPPAGVWLLAWVWLFGGNYLLTAIRFPRWLRRAIERVANQVTPKF
jgi:hypothetical protein